MDFYRVETHYQLKNRLFKYFMGYSLELCRASRNFYHQEYSNHKFLFLNSIDDLEQ